MSAIDIFALLCLTLFLKLLVTTSLQAFARKHAGAYAHAEDAAYWNGRKDDPPLAQQAQLALRNDGENIPIFLALAWAFVASGGSPRALAAYGAVFFVARSVHTFAFVRPRQPLRNRAYVMGLGATFALAVHLAIAVFTQALV